MCHFMYTYVDAYRVDDNRDIRVCRYRPGQGEVSEAGLPAAREHCDRQLVY